MFLWQIRTFDVWLIVLVTAHATFRKSLLLCQIHLTLYNILLVRNAALLYYAAYVLTLAYIVNVPTYQAAQNQHAGIHSPHPVFNGSMPERLDLHIEAVNR